MGPATDPAPTEQTQTPKGPVRMSTKILVKQALKPSGISDWNNSLKGIWASDAQRPNIYTTDQSRYYWDEGNSRKSVQEHSR
jgi:hypothetical protein